MSKSSDLALDEAEKAFTQELEDKEQRIISLNTKQLEIYNHVMDNKEDILFITGSPGVGKSHCVGTIADELVERSHSVIALAPSHQAKVVLRDMINNDSIEFKTIQSHCNFVPKFDKTTGKQTFSWTKRLADYYDYAILDEASMVDSEQFSVLTQSSRKVILVGDKNQLNVIGGKQIDFGSIKTFELTEQMRQENTQSSLYKAIQEFKKAIETGVPPDMTNIQDDESLNIIRHRKDLFNQFIDCESKSKVVAGASNALVDKYNLETKKVLGDDLYESGDILIFQSPCWVTYHQDRKSDFNNGDIVEIRNIEPMEDGYNCKVGYLNSKYSFTIKLALTQDHYQDKCQKLKDIALKDRTKWIDYFSYKNEFAHIKHSYAMTCWKLQGGSYDEVFIDHKDIANIKVWSGKDEYYRSMYVSLSRARKKANILI